MLVLFPPYYPITFRGGGGWNELLNYSTSIIKKCIGNFSYLKSLYLSSLLLDLI